MRELMFYGTTDDAWECLAKLAEVLKFTIYVDRWYYEPKLVGYHLESEELREMAGHRWRLFLWSEVFSVYRPGFVGEPTPTTPSKISVEDSGPCLEFMPPRAWFNHGVQLLQVGGLSYHHLYRNRESNAYEKPPEAMIQAYQAMRLALCKMLSKFYIVVPLVMAGKTRVVVRPVWIAARALELVHTAQAELQVAGGNKGAANVFPTRREAELARLRTPGLG